MAEPKPIEVVFRPPWGGMDVRHNEESTPYPRYLLGVRRDMGTVQGYEAPTVAMLPSSPVRAEYFHRATQTWFVVCGTSIWKKASADTVFERVLNPDGTSAAVVPGSGTVRIFPYDDLIVVQAD